jgi:type II secretory pathway pseudopilin PulG
MVEIAICLAIIGIALVAILGVLPIGMRTQRDNREETIINQDATVLLEAIRSGARGLNDLTNYVYAITNYRTQYPSGTVTTPIGYTYLGSSTVPVFPITSGLRIIGLLSTPEYTATNGAPISSLLYGGYSNHIVTYVRSLSGPAVEKPPQDNPIIQADAFAYRVLCVNSPVATDANAPSLYTTNLTACLHELRLTFLWPQLPNGSLGASRQTFRTMVAGQMTQTFTNGQWLYFYQSQSFTNVFFAP